MHKQIQDFKAEVQFDHGSDPDELEVVVWVSPRQSVVIVSHRDVEKAPRLVLRLPPSKKAEEKLKILNAKMLSCFYFSKNRVL